MNRKFIKSILSCILALMMVVPLLAIPSGAAASISKTALTLTKGYATTLKVNGTSGAVKWSTGNISVATVNSAGKVSGKGVGSTYIYAKVSNTTLKCKVTVVAGKITAGISELTIAKGKTVKVNITAKGTHTISCSTTNKNVASASWNGAKFDDDIVPLTIKGVNNGTARIKIYAKNYPTTVYDYIDITVGNGITTGNNPSNDVVITLQSTSVSVDVNKTASFNVLTTAKDSLTVASGNPSVATFTVGNYRSVSGGYYATVNVKGVSSGKTVVRIYSKSNTKNYKDVNVTVGSSASYYVISNHYPTKNLSTDLVIQYVLNGFNRYMLVPKDYDAAYANSIFAETAKSYEYYIVYSKNPQKKNNSDSIKSFNTGYGMRYILVPRDYDEVAYNTAAAEYTREFEYYLIYNIRPDKNSNRDEIETWTITSSQNKIINRYMLVPYYDAGSSYVEDLIAHDKESSFSYDYYKIYTSKPAAVPSTDILLQWDYGNKTYYMIAESDHWSYNVLNWNDSEAEDGEYRYDTVYTRRLRSSDYPDYLDVNEIVISASTGSYRRPAYIYFERTNASQLGEDIIRSVQHGYSGEVFTD